MNTFEAGTRVRVLDSYAANNGQHVGDNELVGKVGTITNTASYFLEVDLDDPANYKANPYHFLPEELEAV